MREYLYENVAESIGRKFIEKIEIPHFITNNIKNTLREYQVNTIQYFIAYLTEYENNKNKHLMFNMATGSGKTLIMASLILYLYKIGYRNFLFFVHSNSIISKTRDNFFNSSSYKYLFTNEICIDGKKVEIKEVSDFGDTDDSSINIFTTSIHSLHNLINEEKENAFDLNSIKDKKIVLIADEAHHYNAETKNKKDFAKDLFEKEDEETEKNNWENTIKKIFEINKENFLLEFTATIDYEVKMIVDKYKSRTLFKYDLKDYRQAKYSKEIDIIQNDVPKKYLMLGAVIVSEYRRSLATDNGIEMKPVILFKAHKTIKESFQNQELFNELIGNLKEKDINILYKENNKVDIIFQAIDYFKKKYDNFDIFIERIKDSFKKEYQLTTNESKKEKDKANEKEKKEIEKQNKHLNTLERTDNPIRVIFSVDKLNEGWDVLNLFDIVRLYETRDTDFRKKKAGKTTIKEAQLIGRGARYYPFNLDVKHEDDIYKRKYDNCKNEPKKILETLYYHSIKDSRYISELKDVLKEHGLIETMEYEETVFTIKEELREYIENTFVFLNRKKIKTEANENGFFIEAELNKIKSIENITSSLQEMDMKHYSKTFQRNIEVVFEDNTNTALSNGKAEKIIMKDINEYIKINEWYRQNYDFDDLKKIFPSIESVKNFLGYFNNLMFYFYGLDKNSTNGNKEYEYKSFLNETFYPALIKILKNEYSEYEGTTVFYPKRMKEVFGKEKTKRIYGENQKEIKNNIAEYEKIAEKEYYAQNMLLPDSGLETNLLNEIHVVVDNLKEKGYKDIYLFRNDKEVPIYDFESGRAFYPDFILVCQYKKKELNYQIFIESKGDYLTVEEKWKEDFLKKIKENNKLNRGMFSINTDKYTIFGMEFFRENNKTKWFSELENEIEKKREL